MKKLTKFKFKGKSANVTEYDGLFWTAFLTGLMPLPTVRSCPD